MGDTGDGFRVDLAPVQRGQWHDRSKLTFDLLDARPLLPNQSKRTGSGIDAFAGKAFEHMEQRQTTVALSRQRESFLQSAERSRLTSSIKGHTATRSSLAFDDGLAALCVSSGTASTGLLAIRIKQPRWLQISASQWLASRDTDEDQIVLTSVAMRAISVGGSPTMTRAWTLLDVLALAGMVSCSPAPRASSDQALILGNSVVSRIPRNARGRYPCTA